MTETTSARPTARAVLDEPAGYLSKLNVWAAQCVHELHLEGLRVNGRGGDTWRGFINGDEVWMRRLDYVPCRDMRQANDLLIEIENRGLVAEYMTAIWNILGIRSLGSYRDFFALHNATAEQRTKAAILAVLGSTK